MPALHSWLPCSPTVVTMNCVFFLYQHSQTAGKVFPYWRRKRWRWRWRWRRWQFLLLETNNPKDNTKSHSSAFWDRYLAIGSHVAKTRSCPAMFLSLSLSLSLSFAVFHFHAHSNTLPSLSHLILSQIIPPSLASLSPNNELLLGLWQKLFFLLQGNSWHRFFSFSLSDSLFISFSFYCESGWSLEYELTGASSLLNCFLSFPFSSPLFSSLPFFRS